MIQYKNDSLLNKAEKNCWKKYMISRSGKKTAEYYKKNGGVIAVKERDKYRNITTKIKEKKLNIKKKDRGTITNLTNF